MKSTFLLVVALLSLFALAGVPGYGETIQLSGTVPFEFVAGSQTMPAGDYTLRPCENLRGGWTVSGPARLMIETQEGPATQAGEKPRLVFHRYGKQYFLAQIWTSGSGHVLEIPVSPKERQVIKEMSARGTVAVAMR